MDRLWRIYGICAIALIAFSIASLALQAGESENLFVVDDKVKPIFRELQPYKDGKQRLVAAIADSAGRQDEFVEDEMWVATASTEVLNAFLLRWQGKILASYPAKEKGQPTRYLARINPELADPSDLERWVSVSKYDPQAHYRVSVKRGLLLLAAVIKEQAAAKSEKSENRTEYEANWVGYKDSISMETVAEHAWLEKMIQRNCGYLFRQEIELLRQVTNDGPDAALAEQQLMEQVPNEDCAPPLPTFTLVNGLILPEVQGGSSFTFILNRPPNVAQGFTAAIISAQGGFVSQPPWGGTLYGGSVYLNSDGSQLAIATQPSFVLPACARSEKFTIRLTHANGVSDYEVTLPVRLQIPGIGTANYNFSPGVNVDIPLCAAGERGSMQWNWQPTSGAAFPPPGMSLVPEPNGDARLTGAPQVNSYQTLGAFQVQKAGKTATRSAQIVVAVNFGSLLGTACGQHNIKLEVFFQCELPRPLGYNSHTWTLQTGAAPAGLNLIQRSSIWYIEGTVPLSSLQCPICTPQDTLGLYTLNLVLTASGYSGPLATRQVTIDVGIPFTTWTQNTQLRPSASPVVANTGDDNEERTQLLLNRINAGTFDIIALQEVFDESQRDQLSLGLATDNYNLLWGPDELVYPIEESGIALIIKGDPSTDWGTRQSQLSSTHYIERFNDCTDADCLSNKGFSVSAVRAGLFATLWIVNTHMQAGSDSDHNGIRLTQLAQIVSHVSTLPPTDPVLFLGDLNIAGGQPEYLARMSDVLTGWLDLIAGASGNFVTPFTADKTRNAYAHFWHGEEHITEHELEDIAIRQGSQACLTGAPFTLTDACFPPIAHPSEQGRIDHMLIRQGTQYNVVIDSFKLEDTPVTTTVCRDEFGPQLTDAGHGNLQCYLSDHFGLSAGLRLVKR